MVVYYGFFQFVFMMQDNFVVYFFGNQLCGFLVDDLVDGCYGVQFYYCFDDLRIFYCYFVSQFVNGDGFVDYDVMVNGLCWFLEVLLQSGIFMVFIVFIVVYGCVGFFMISF